MLLITGPQRARSKINWARAVLELAIVLAGAPEQETAPAAALELAIGLAVVPELGTAPVVALALELVQVAVALRTKSATGAHRQDLVPLLTAEASAVAGVETSLAPAATEAAIAWAGADSAAVAAEEDAVAAAAEDKQIISMREN
jgi:hypothetical protein